MIRIDRTLAQAPQKLQTQGQAALAVIRPLAQSTPPTLQSDHFDTKIYGTAEVKEALWHMQHHKCCFCERECESAHSTIEHFRPKTQARDQKGATPRAGYWWLAYEFENFYFCCPNCNTQKNDIFPLAPNTAAIPPEQHPWNTNPQEQAILIDPGHEDPEAHIDWVVILGRRPMPTHKTDRGKRTIAVLKLERDSLTSLREKYYILHIAPLIEDYKTARAENNTANIQRACDKARKYAESSAPYAGMTRAILRREGLI